MPNLIIAPARLKLAPGTPLPESIRLTFVASGCRPLSDYWISRDGVSIWPVNSDEEGRIYAEPIFRPDRMGDFQFELSQHKDAPQGSGYVEANRAFRIEYVEPKPSRWQRLKELARRQYARLVARGEG